MCDEWCIVVKDELFNICRTLRSKCEKTCSGVKDLWSWIWVLLRRLM